MRYYDYSKTQLENEADSLNESFDKEHLIRPKKIDVYDVVDFILATNKKGVGLDVIGIDPIPDEDLPIHKRLFREHEIVNIENLKNLDKCGDDLFWFFALPLKWEKADGAPIRAVAFWE